MIIKYAASIIRDYRGESRKEVGNGSNGSVTRNRTAINEPAPVIIGY